MLLRWGIAISKAGIGRFVRLLKPVVALPIIMGLVDCDAITYTTIWVQRVLVCFAPSSMRLTQRVF
jgi:hypothetical protein